MTIEQMIEVMQAYKEGKKIQCRYKDGDYAWDDAIKPSWNFSVLNYRINPEPKYRPYKDTDEMVADWKTRFNKLIAPNTMPSIWVMNDKVKAIITDFAKNAVSVFGAFQSMGKLYEEFTYLDGSPCGKEDK